MILLALLVIGPVLYLLIAHRGKPGAVPTLLTAFLGGLVVWLATMSWPLGPHGDYLPWQVVLSGALMVLLTVVAAVRCPAVGGPVGWSAASGFALAWGVWAFAQDDTGQSGAGLIFLILGAGGSLALVGLIVGALRRRVGRGAAGGRRQAQ
ncbi:MAG: hypothetical protein GX859_11245 [Corynebacterium humireducens]|jgi:hypothetical protein|uniref:Uncharacterized protein n=1 Tax=Corynebacterium humireducens TaxID=1223514 RepID=A0A7X6PQ62_9CORY|nr:hypothetical protein [Corynebacterium humireducens]